MLVEECRMAACVTRRLEQLHPPVESRGIRVSTMRDASAVSDIMRRAP